MVDSNRQESVYEALVPAKTWAGGPKCTVLRTFRWRSEYEESTLVGWLCCQLGASFKEPRAWLASPTPPPTLRISSGDSSRICCRVGAEAEWSRPRPSALLREHEDTPRRPFSVESVHVPPSEADSGDAMAPPGF